MNRKKKKVHENFRKKKSVSQSTQNALKRIEMQKQNFTPMIDYAPSGVVQSLSGGSVWFFWRSVNIRDLFAETGQSDRQTNKQNHRTTNPIDPPLPEGSKKTN